MPGDKKRAKNLARILLFDSCVYGVVAHVLVGEGTHADCVVHLVVSVTFCAKIPSVPQEKPMLSVHGTMAGGGAPVQKLLATALPSVRTQLLAGGIVVMSRGLPGEFKGALPHAVGDLRDLGRHPGQGRLVAVDPRAQIPPKPA